MRADPAKAGTRRRSPVNGAEDSLPTPFTGLRFETRHLCRVGRGSLSPNHFQTRIILTRFATDHSVNRREGRSMADQIADVERTGAQLRVDSIRCTTAAGSGHPTSSMSAADLMAVLLAKYLRFDWANPQHPNNDRLIFSKGHACPLLYSMFKAAGAITDAELLTPAQVRQPARGPSQPARAAPAWTSPPARSARGCPSASAWRSTASTSTSCPTASGSCSATAKWPRAPSGRRSTRRRYYKLDNLIAILDMNRLGQRGETDLGWNSAAYAARARAFGWHAIELDGHDLVGHRRGLRRGAGAEGSADVPGRQDGQGRRACRSWPTRKAGTARR